jgi:hypothetical protein
MPLFNPFIKKPNIEMEYSSDNIKEIIACKNDIFHFLQYVKIVTIDQGEVPFDPYKFQSDLLYKFSKHRFNCCLASRQSGKCVNFDTMITIRNKETGEISTISIGDFFNKI